MFPTPMITVRTWNQKAQIFWYRRLRQVREHLHTPIAVPATRKHDTPINCILGVPPMIQLFNRAKKRIQI